MDEAQTEIEWLRKASGSDLVDLATDQLGLKPLAGVAADMSAVELGNLEHEKLLELLDPLFRKGTCSASDLADQIQLCRAFAKPTAVTEAIAKFVEEKVQKFPRNAANIRVGHNAGDVLDPFILAANYELLSERDLSKTIEHTVSHKVLMKIEDLVGNLHQTVIGEMRGNFRVPEPQGSRKNGKEKLNSDTNPFPGADIGQVPVPEHPEAIRLFQVKSKTGSAKGGDGKRLGEQLNTLKAVYDAHTFYVSIVGTTLKGHRSRGAVQRESPETAVLVGSAALNELTQSRVGGELLLRTYQRAFRAAAAGAGYKFSEIIPLIVAEFECDADVAGTDFLSAWLHSAIGGEPEDQDSRISRSKGKQAAAATRPRKPRARKRS